MERDKGVRSNYWRFVFAVEVAHDRQDACRSRLLVGGLEKAVAVAVEVPARAVEKADLIARMAALKVPVTAAAFTCTPLAVTKPNAQLLTKARRNR